MFKQIILTTSLLMSTLAFAQTKQEEKIDVIAEAEIDIPADQVLFSINLNYKDYDNVKTAFDLHKSAETKLLSLLKKLKVPTKNITYSLISFQRQTEFMENGKRRDYFGTQQNIDVKIEELASYPAFLIELVNEGFTNVSTAFTSSKANDFHATLIEKAIEQAKKKAEVMAKASGRKLGRVTRVSDTVQSDPVFRAELGYAKMANNDGFISQIPQSVKKNVTVNVVFELE